MKKLSFLVALVITCSLVFAFSVNPSMDGRAVVADNGVFPPGGYYGRAPGYLPGDTVIVTNHSNGFSIDVLILGSYDAYEGIAILLSPDAAEKLQIVKGKDTYVKVQKKQPIPYEEAVATSRNKKPTQKVVDTDKDSSVLPGESESKLQKAIESSKKINVPDDDIELTHEEVKPLEEETDRKVLDNLKPLSEENSTAVDETQSPRVVSDLLVKETISENIAEDNSAENEAELEEIVNEEISNDDYIVVDSVEIQNDAVVEEITSIPEDNLNNESMDEVSKVDENTSIEEPVVVEEIAEKELPEEIAPIVEENEISEVENSIVDEPQDEVILADPEEYVESESIDSPIFAEEIVPEETIVEEPIIDAEDEIVLDDITNEAFDENDVIDSPVKNEIAQVEPEQVVEPELPVDDSEEVVLEDLSEQESEDLSDVIPTDEIADVESPFVKEIEDGYVVEYLYADAEESDAEEVTTEEESEVEEVLIPEEELALEDEESATEEEITDPEILDTDVLEEEPELAILDDQYDLEKTESNVNETPKDIFSMIVGENPDEEILHDVILEEAEPKLPEDDKVADMKIVLEQPELEPVTNISEVVIPENEDSKVLSSVLEKEYTEADEFKNTVSSFNDLPKVKQVKSKTYYIQIATVSKKENVAKMVEVHGQKYPVYVLQNSTNNMYQVLIGPLNDDEYALVLARFKQTYKDAFLRVLK